MKLPLPLHSYTLRSSPASPARLVNCFPEALLPDAVYPVILTRAPGVKAWTTVGTGPIKGMYAAAVEFATGNQDYLYVVSGSEWYYVPQTAGVAGTPVLIGNTGNPSRIDMASSATDVVLVNEPKGYAWSGPKVTGTHTAVSGNITTMIDSTASFTPNGLIGGTISNTTDSSSGVIIDNDEISVTVTALLGGTDNDWDTSDAYSIDMFREITDDDFVSRGAGDVEYLDKVFIFREPNSDRFFIGDIGSATSFDALQFAKTDDTPDQLTGILADRGILLAFGSKAIEVWENTGTAGVPFERIINGTVEVGCLTSKSIARVFNRVLFVADDYTVRMFEGFQPMRASTHAIEQKLAKETIISSMAYSQEGHFFYSLTTDGGTYLYDIVTAEWSERESYGKANWSPQTTQPFAGKILVGDSDSNKIGELDFDTYADWGTTSRMEWTYQPVYAEGQRAFHDRLEIGLETGVGLTTGQGVDPKIMLQKSDDGGETWQSLPDKSIGALGKRLVRPVWHNLGSARERVYRAAVSDPVSITITDTIIEVRGGRL